MSYSVKAEIY